MTNDSRVFAYLFLVLTLLASAWTPIPGRADDLVSSKATVDEWIEDLSTNGITIDGKTVKLTPMWISDGMDAADQKKKTDELAGRLRERFYRDSIPAPFFSKITSIKSEDRRSGYIVDFAFVVYGSLDELRVKEGETSLQNALSGESEMEITPLDSQALKRCGIEAATEDRFVHGTFVLLDKVRLSGVVRTRIRQSDESITSVWQLDERFTIDQPWSNSWQYVDDESRHAYSGFAGYAKATRLQSIDDAILVEYHYAFSEPAEWAAERISLRAKLAIVIQEGIRKARRHIRKLSGR